MRIESKLVQRHNDKNDREEWALISKKSGRVLKWFGTQKPSEEHVKKEEQRVQYWKHHGSLLTEILAKAEPLYHTVRNAEDAEAIVRRGYKSRITPEGLYAFHDHTGFDTAMKDMLTRAEPEAAQAVYRKRLDSMSYDDIADAWFDRFGNGQLLWVAKGEPDTTYGTHIVEFEPDGAAKLIYQQDDLEHYVYFYPNSIIPASCFKMVGEKNAEAIVDPRFEEEPTRQAFKDALPFEGPWNGYGQKSPIEKVYPAISRVLAGKTYEKMDPAKFKYSNAQGFITEDGSYYQIHETHSDAMQENPGFDRPTVVSVGHDGGNNVTFPFSVWDDPKAKQHRTLRILLGALDAHGFGWEDMEVGLGDYWYHATKVIKVNPKAYMKVGPKAKIASLLLSIIDPRHESPKFRKNFVAPVDQTYGWGMGNGVAEEPNPMHTEAEEDETKTKK